MKRWSRTELERLMDVSTVQAPDGIENVRRLAEFAKERSFCAVHALPNWVPVLKEMMSGNSVTLVGSSVGFPSGAHATATKVFEARQLIADGVGEMDMMINVGRLKSGHFDYVRDDIKAIADVKGGRTLKVILESYYLTDDEIKKACELCIEAGADYVKTGSGWTKTSATLDTLSLITGFVKGAIKVKASGGIRDLETIDRMVQMGVSRFGINTEALKKILARVEKG